MGSVAYSAARGFPYISVRQVWDCGTRATEHPALRSTVICRSPEVSFLTAEGGLGAIEDIGGGRAMTDDSWIHHAARFLVEEH